MRIFLNSIVLLSLLVVISCRSGSADQTSSPQTTEKQAVRVNSPEGANIDSIQITSSSMKKEIDVLIVTPASYGQEGHEPFPVLYLLHGAEGDHTSWIEKSPLKNYANQYQMIIVCPDGDEYGWYLDSPVDPSFQYETFMTEELVPFVDAHYRTETTSTGRAICGLSMGGHGAFFLSFRHQDIWGVAGSISGGLNLMPFPDSWELKKRLGEQSSHKKNWSNHSVVNLVHLLSPHLPSLIFDCGEQDFFFAANEELHLKLEDMGLPHTYTTRPGAHDWEYFAASLPDHLEFFDSYFQQ